jgi:hypothetical protein
MSDEGSYMTYPFFCDITLYNTLAEPIPNFNKAQTSKSFLLKISFVIILLFTFIATDIQHKAWNETVKNTITIPILREQ